jgi:lysozyme
MEGKMKQLKDMRCLQAVVVAFLLGSSAPVFAQIVSPPPGTSPQELGLPVVTDDVDPQELFAEVVNAANAEDAETVAKGREIFNLWGPFRFPTDVTWDVVEHHDRTNSFFGPDISRWTDDAFPIEKLAEKHALFLYVKATQGVGVDSKFATFWARAGALKPGHQVHRGAYHFLTCGDPAVAPDEWGKRQADIFVKVVKANGLRATDMPPALDLEWDKTSTVRDRWTCRQPQDIVKVTKAFLAEVKQQLGRTPILYTSRAWWHERMGGEALFGELAGYLYWGADYSKSARGTEIPPKIANINMSIWQFTDSATMASGYNHPFDASVFKGTPADFLKTFSVEGFQ